MYPALYTNMSSLTNCIFNVSRSLNTSEPTLNSIASLKAFCFASSKVFPFPITRVELFWIEFEVEAHDTSTKHDAIMNNLNIVS